VSDRPALRRRRDGRGRVLPARNQIGVGPGIVVLDGGTAKTLTTSTVQSDIYAFIVGQQGLMTGPGIQGSKITRINS
jgi:hypothetical protein